MPNPPQKRPTLKADPFEDACVRATNLARFSGTLVAVDISLESGHAITFDFDGVTGATQSFVHALVSDALRKYPSVVYDNVFYKNANEEVQKIITIVYRYMQESL